MVHVPTYNRRHCRHSTQYTWRYQHSTAGATDQRQRTLPTLYSGSYRQATEGTTDTLQRELPTSDRGHYRHDTERRYRQPTWRYRQATEGATIPELRSHNYRVFSRSIGQMEGHACSVHLNVVLLFPQDGPSCNSTICTLHMSNLVSQQMFLKCSSFGRHEINKNPREVLPNEHLLHESW